MNSIIQSETRLISHAQTHTRDSTKQNTRYFYVLTSNNIIPVENSAKSHISALSPEDRPFQIHKETSNVFNKILNYAYAVSEGESMPLKY
jgi:hypothetical protein